jgi:flagellin-like protein
MRGVSEVIAIILILMITISLAGLAYNFIVDHHERRDIQCRFVRRRPNTSSMQDFVYN